MSVFTKRWLLTAWLLCLPGAALAQTALGDAPAARPGSGAVIESFTLANGMPVYVVPNPIVPAVNHMIFYRVGAADDPPGKSGLAHFAEHIMFKGTQEVPIGEFSKRVARQGGEDNAFTSRDYTAYYQKIAKQHLPMVMEMEADRMQHLLLNDAEIAKEREVVIEERHGRTESDVEGFANEQMDAALFLHHPYRLPIIGWEHEIKALGREDLAAHVARAYHPANAFLVVSGDVTKAEAQRLAEKFYGNIPAGKPLARAWDEEPPARAAKRLALTHPLAKQPFWWRAYQAPSHLTAANAQEPYALLVLSYLLGADKLGRLYEELVVRKKLATDISVDYRPVQRGPSSFELVVQPVAGASLEAIEKAVDAQLARLLAAPPGESELAQAKDALTAWRVYQQEGLSSTAFSLGIMLATGLSIEDFQQYDARIQTVTAAEIQQAAKALIRPEASVTAVLRPEERTP